MPEVYTAETLDERLRISEPNLIRLMDYVKRELGIKLGDHKTSMVQSRLIRRVRDLGLRNIDEYCDHLFSPGGGDKERTHFFNAVTTNKTEFFREPQHFDFLTRTALPQLTARFRSGPLAVWSAACSSGEEPYTLAMVLSEFAHTHPGVSFRILGTDISTRVLHTAKLGIYPRQVIEPVPNDLRFKYLMQGKKEHAPLVRIIPALRSTVSFQQLNLMSPDYTSDKFDIIVCRNVLIYFDRVTQESVIQKLCHCLKPGGYLLVGHSESLSGMDLPVVSLGSSCFRKTGDGDSSERRLR